MDDPGRDRFIRSLYHRAIDGAVGHLPPATVLSDDPGAFKAVIKPPGLQEVTVDLRVVNRGARRCYRAGKPGAPPIRELSPYRAAYLREAIRQRDAEHLTNAEAWMIVQVGLWGEVVYVSD